MITHIASQGKVIGKFSPDDLLKALQNGTIKPTDHWWRVGMKDWIMVTSQSPLNLTQQMTAQSIMPQVSDKESDCTRISHLSGDGLNAYCTLSGKLRREIFFSLKIIESLKAKLSTNYEGRPDERGFDMNQIMEEIESARFDIETLNEHRAQYWLSLIEMAKNDDKESIISMHVGMPDLLPAIHHGLVRPDQVMEPSACIIPADLNDRLYRLANRLPKIPSQERVLNILKQLDERSRTWDDDQPDLLLLEFLKMPG